MKLPASVVIAPEKLRDYLLVRRPEDDKSLWLEQAGYHRAAWRRLEADLRAQLLSLDAQPARSTSFGQMYEISGVLTGPNGTQIHVRTFWMTESETGLTKFITMYPDKEQKP